MIHNNLFTGLIIFSRNKNQTMDRNKATPNKKDRQPLIEKSVTVIYKRAESREKAGRDPFEAGWQATLEIMLLMMENHLLEHPGQMLPMQINGQKEWEFYLGVQENSAYMQMS